MDKLKPLPWAEYCPQMRPLKNWTEVMRDRVNREAEAMIDDSDLYIIPPHIRQWRPAKRKKAYEAGWYNFVRYTIQSYLP